MSDELELSPNSKYISEIYTDESELEMLKMDFVGVADTMDEWLEEMYPSIQIFVVIWECYFSH